MTEMTGRMLAPAVLTDAMFEQYRNTGYVILRGVLDAEDIQRLRDECDLIESRGGCFDTLLKPRRNFDGAEIRERVEALADLSGVFRNLSRDERLRAPLRQLCGGEPALFKDKANFRPPGTSGFQLHQDYTGFAFTGVPATDMLTVMIAIDPVTTASGALEVFPGFQDQILPDMPDDPRTLDPAWVEGCPSELIELEPGDICLFHVLVPHRSSPNCTDRPRRVAFLTYNPARYGDFRRAYYDGREAIYRK